MAAVPANVFPWRSQTLRPMAARAMKATGADGVAIALKIGGDIICEASIGAAPSVGSKVDGGSSWSARCMREGLPVCVSHSSELAQASYSAILAPILHAGYVIGFCGAFASRADAFTASHLRTLVEIAQTAARTVNVDPAPEPAPKPAPVESPQVSLVSPEILKRMQDDIAAFAAAEKHRARVMAMTKWTLAAVLVIATCASCFPDQVRDWTQPIFYRINRSLQSSPPQRYERPATPRPSSGPVTASNNAAR